MLHAGPKRMTREVGDRSQKQQVLPHLCPSMYGRSSVGLAFDHSRRNHTLLRVRHAPHARVQEARLQPVAGDPAFPLGVVQSERCSHLYTHTHTGKKHSGLSGG